MTASRVPVERVRFRDLFARVTDAEHGIERMRTTRDSWRQRFGEEASRQRKTAGIGLREMARSLDVSPQMLHDFEKGRRWSSGIAFQIMRAFERE